MRTCVMCGNEIPDGAVECPVCKFKINSIKNENDLYRSTTNSIKQNHGTQIVVFSVCVVVIVCIFFSIFKAVNYGFNNMNQQETPDQTTAENEKAAILQNIKLLDGAKITNDSFYYIEGTIENKNDVDVRGVVITFTLYDADGSLIDTKWDIASLIEANGTYKFKINCGFNEPSSFNLKSIEIH